MRAQGRSRRCTVRLNWFVFEFRSSRSLFAFSLSLSQPRRPPNLLRHTKTQPQNSGRRALRRAPTGAGRARPSLQGQGDSRGRDAGPAAQGAARRSRSRSRGRSWRRKQQQQSHRRRQARAALRGREDRAEHGDAAPGCGGACSDSRRRGGSGSSGGGYGGGGCSAAAAKVRKGVILFSLFHFVFKRGEKTVKQKQRTEPD